MAPEMQVRLLRVLETGRFTRVGGEEELRSRVRIIAATNRDPAAGGQRRATCARTSCTASRCFRSRCPPLRDREGDAELLAEHFLAELNEAEGTRKAVHATVDRDHSRAPVAGQRARAQERRSPRVHPRRCRRRARLRGTRMRGAGRQLSAHPRRHAVGRDRAAGDLRDPRPVRRQQAALREMLGVSLKTLYNRLAEYQAGDIEISDGMTMTHRPATRSGQPRMSPRP